MNTDSIFKDLVVIELASALAGPSVGMFFAELGAKVIKVENKITGGDVTRRWKIPAEDPNDAFSAYYHATNWGKESHLLNLKNSADQERVYEWIKEADIVISNFKYGSSVKLGMDYKTIKKYNPRIIYANVYAYDEDDPRPGFDAVMQAETGWMYMNGQKDGPPTKAPLPIVDILAGHQLKEGILIGLLQRAKTGEGSHISVSLYDASVSAMTNQASTYLNLGIIPERIGSQHPSIAPYGDVVHTIEGTNYLLAVGTQEHFESLCDVISREGIKTDQRFITNSLRLANRNELVSLIQDAVGLLSAEAFESRCEEYGVPFGQIRNLGQLFAEEDGQELILEEKMEDGRISKRVKTVVFKVLEE